MAEINTEGKGGKKKGKPKKMSTRVDFTPMVDLGFLLITFFMLATSMIKPQTMEIVMPTKDDTKSTKDNTKVQADKAVTILLDKNNKIYYYEGTWGKDGSDPKLVQTDYSPNGLRKYLLGRNAIVMNKVRNFKAEIKGKDLPADTITRRITRIKSSNKDLVVIIKATKEATYGNLVNVLDEMNICNVGVYAVVDIKPEDLKLLDKYGSK